MKRGTPEHPKTLWLKAGLGISKANAVGLLELLFHFTARHAPQGDIGKWSNAQIAEGVDWGGDPDVLIAQLSDAGYIDPSRKHRLLIHDWPDHADQAVKKYLQRNHLEFLAPVRRVRTKNGHGRPYTDGHGRTAVAVAVAVAKPSQANTSTDPPHTDAAPPDALTVPGEIPPVESIALAKARVTGEQAGIELVEGPNGPALLVEPLPWNREAADLWWQEYKGQPPPAYFAALKPAVKKYTWERVRPALVTYMAETPADYVNIAGKFVSCFGTWEARARGTRAPPQPSERARGKDVGDMALIRAGMKGGGHDDGRGLGAGDDGAALPAGAGRDTGAEGDSRRRLPPGTRPSDG